MDYLDAVRSSQSDPKHLEELYRSAQAGGGAAAWASAIEACHREVPENPVLAAWHYRLQPVEEPRAADRMVNWKIALSIALIAGAVCAVLSLPAFDYRDGMPYLALIWSLVGGAAIIAYLTIAGQERSSIWSALLAVAVAGAYVTVLSLGGRRVAYRTLMMIHLPLLAVTGIACRGHGFVFCVRGLRRVGFHCRVRFYN